MRGCRNHPFRWGRRERVARRESNRHRIAALDERPIASGGDGPHEIDVLGPILEISIAQRRLRDERRAVKWRAEMGIGSSATVDVISEDIRRGGAVYIARRRGPADENDALCFIGRAKRLRRSWHIALRLDPDDVREGAKSSPRIHQSRGVEPSAIEQRDRPIFNSEHLFGGGTCKLSTIEDGQQTRAFEEGVFRRGITVSSGFESAIDFEAICGETASGQRFQIRAWQSEPDHIALLLSAYSFEARGQRA